LIEAIYRAQRNAFIYIYRNIALDLSSKGKIFKFASERHVKKPNSYQQNLQVCNWSLRMCPWSMWLSSDLGQSNGQMARALKEK
jgi:hypothetical protein